MDCKLAADHHLSYVMQEVATGYRASALVGDAQFSKAAAGAVAEDVIVAMTQTHQGPFLQALELIHLPGEDLN